MLIDLLHCVMAYCFCNAHFRIYFRRNCSHLSSKPRRIKHAAMAWKWLQ